MENKTIYRPLQPNKPDLLRLKTYTFADFYSVDLFCIVVFVFVYTLYRSGEFDSLDLYYTCIAIYLAIRLWPFVITNNLNKSENNKMIDHYQTEITKYNKKLEEFLKYDKEKNGLNSIYHPFYVSDYDAMKTEEYFQRKEEKRKKSLIAKQTYKSNSLPENRPFLNNSPRIDIESKINDTIKNYSGICAALAIQPIPFADIFILTPTQIIMGKKIADLRGYKINENTIESILKEISGIIGMGIIAQQLVIGAYKTILPFLGGITTIPAVYGLTYGIGKVMDYYILAKKNGTQINKSDIEKIFKTSREIGQHEGKSKEKEILAKARK